MTAKFRQLPDESEDIEMEWSLFRSGIIASAVVLFTTLKSGGDGEKRTSWWNQDVKEAIRAKKDAVKALLQNRSQKATALAVKKSKKKTTGGVQLSVGFQLFISKQSILTNDPSFAWKKM